MSLLFHKIDTIPGQRDGSRLLLGVWGVEGGLSALASRYNDLFFLSLRARPPRREQKRQLDRNQGGRQVPFMAPSSTPSTASPVRWGEGVTSCALLIKKSTGFVDRQKLVVSRAFEWDGPVGSGNLSFPFQICWASHYRDDQVHHASLIPPEKKNAAWNRTILMAFDSVAFSVQLNVAMECQKTLYRARDDSSPKPSGYRLRRFPLFPDIFRKMAQNSPWETRTARGCFGMRFDKGSDKIGV